MTAFLCVFFVSAKYLFMTKYLFTSFAVIAVAVFALSVLPSAEHAAYAHQGATGIVKERMDEFQKARGQMKQIRRALESQDFAAIAALSDDMMPWAHNMAEAFPEGSDIAPSEALPAIWQDEAGFAQAISDYRDAITALNLAAQSGDNDAVRTGYKRLGSTCKSCHSTYRQ